MHNQNQPTERGVGYYIKFLLKDSLFYGSLSVLTRFLSIFTMPIFTRLFSKADYGSLDVLSVLGGVFSTVVVLGLDAALIRFFSDCDSHEKRSRIVSVVLLVASSAGVVVALALYFSASFFTEILLPAHGYTLSFKLMVAYLPFSLILLLCQNVLKITFARRPFAILSLGSSVAIVLLSILLVVKFHMGVNGIFIAQLAGYVTFSLIGLYCCREYLLWPSSFEGTAPLLTYGLPVMLTLVASMSLPIVDRFFITRYFGMDVMGLYAVAYKIALLIKMPVSAFQMAWGPLSLSIYKNDNAADVYNKVLFYYVLVLSLFVFTLALYAKPIALLLASQKYAGAELLVLPLAFGVFFESVGALGGIGVDLAKKTYLNLLSYGIGIMAGLGVIIVFVKPFGVMGIAYGILTSQVIRAAFLITFAHRVYPLRFALKVPAFMAVIMFLLAQIASVVKNSPLLHLGAGTAILAVVSVSAFKWLLPIEDKEYVIRILRPIFSRSS
jgi:O-antigen/teichoic acid export membrane protein